MIKLIFMSFKVNSQPFNSSLKRAPPFCLSSSMSRIKDKHNIRMKFQKCLGINISLLDAIKHVIDYANFFKELCIAKRNEKLKVNETINTRQKYMLLLKEKKR